MPVEKSVAPHRFDLGKTAEELVPDLSNRFAYILALVFAILGAGATAWLWRRLPPIVPLYFTEPWGEAELAPKIFLLLLPAATVIIVIINILLGNVLGKTTRVIPRILSVAAAVVALMFLVGVVGIIQSLFL